MTIREFSNVLSVPTAITTPPNLAMLKTNQAEWATVYDMSKDGEYDILVYPNGTNVPRWITDILKEFGCNILRIRHNTIVSEVFRMMTVSTGLLSENTRQEISDINGLDIYDKTLHDDNFGWYIINIKNIKTNDPTIPEDLMTAITDAKQKNCDILCFDADVPVEDKDIKKTERADEFNPCPVSYSCDICVDWKDCTNPRKSVF